METELSFRFAVLLLMASLTPLSAAAVDFAALRSVAVQGAVARVRPAVVQLQPFGGGGGSLTDATTSPTTGLLLGDEGLIVTSSHGLDPAPTSIIIRFDDGSRAAGKLLAIDHNRRIALVDANRTPQDVSPVEMAPTPRVGQTAIAIGRTFRAEEPNVAVGIVSALGRFHGRAVQTDAAASPANYGGPLVDFYGRVLGIVTPLAADGEGPSAGAGWYDSGIGFAVPLGDIRTRVPRLRRREAIHRGLAGVAFASGQEYTTAPELAAVHPGGPADRAGLKADDLLLAVDEEPIETVAAYRRATSAHDDGETLTFRVRRDQEELEAQVTLVAELTAYRHAFLGLAVDDTGDAPGVEITTVVAGGPAADKIAVGDQLLKLDGEPLDTRDDLLNRLKAVTPGDEVRLTINHGGQTRTEIVTAAKLAYDPEPIGDKTFEVTSTELVVPGSEQKASLLKPTNARGRRPTIVWLGGERDAKLVEQVVAAGCLVIRLEELANARSEESPSPDAMKAYLGDLLDLIVTRADVDAERIAAGGAGRQSAMALAVGQRMRQRFAGVVLNRWLAGRPQVTANTPSDRLGFLIFGDDQRSEAVGELIDKGGYPLHRMAGETLRARVVAAWVASLDRL